MRRKIAVLVLLLLTASCCKRHSRGVLTPQSVPTVNAAVAAFGKGYEVRAWRPADSARFHLARQVLEANEIRAEDIRVYEWRWSAFGRNGRPCEEVFVVADRSGRVFDIYRIWHT
jgi:hypothetical protein